MSAQEVCGLAEKFERTISRRNQREYAAAAFVVVWFGVWAWFTESAVVALGGWLVVLAALWVVFHLHRRGAARRPAGEQGVISGLEFHRSELVRQRDLLRSVWWWFCCRSCQACSSCPQGNRSGGPHGWLWVSS